MIKVAPKYTYTHQIFISMSQDDARKFYNKCLDYGISINLRNKELYKRCGLRIGTQEVSRYGWADKEMTFVAEILRDIRDNNDFSQDISNKINMISANKKICYTFGKEYYDILYAKLHYS